MKNEKFKELSKLFFPSRTKQNFSRLRSARQRAAGSCLCLCCDVLLQNDFHLIFSVLRLFIKAVVEFTLSIEQTCYLESLHGSAIESVNHDWEFIQMEEHDRKKWRDRDVDKVVRRLYCTCGGLRHDAGPCLQLLQLLGGCLCHRLLHLEVTKLQINYLSTAV